MSYVIDNKLIWWKRVLVKISYDENEYWSKYNLVKTGNDRKEKDTFLVKKCPAHINHGKA